MPEQIIIPRQLDANGDSASGAKAYVYETGTTNPVTSYTDTALTVPHANPIVSDSAGYFAQAFYGGATALKVVVTDSADATLVTYDPVPLVSLSASAAENISFSPTAEISETDVQAAIVSVEASVPAVGTDVQAYDPLLVALAGQVTAANQVQGYSGVDAATLYTVGTAANNLVQLDGSAALPAVDGSSLTGTAHPGAHFTYEFTGTPDEFPIAWGELTLNTTRKSGLGISLASSQLTFATAGTYYFDARVSTHNNSAGGREGKIRIRNTTAATSIEGAGCNTQNLAAYTLFVSGELAVSASDVIEVQGIASATGLDIGKDLSSLVETNVPLDVRIWRVS